MNDQRERILQQLREAAEEGLNSEAFYQMMRRAVRFGPVPRDLLRDIMQRRLAGKVPQEGPVLSPEQQEGVRAQLRRFHEPSERARDLNHPIGAVARAIREALPTFRPWQVDVSTIDLNAVARKFCEDRAAALSYLVPPHFAEDSSDAYVTAERSLLIEDEDRSVLTMGELMERKTSQEAFQRQMREGNRLSDAIGLAWKQREPLELRRIEEFLRGLAEKIVPSVPLRFLPRQEPRFRAALRMDLGDSPIPAATGGVLHHTSVLPQGVHVASLTLHLEAWASARTGKPVELSGEPAFPFSPPKQGDRASA